MTVTEANLDYIGSITIDEDLMDAADILPGEHVYIVDNNNGERLETYAIPGERGSGVICLNGAAARKVQPGDIVIIMLTPRCLTRRPADSSPRLSSPTQPPTVSSNQF